MPGDIMHDRREALVQEHDEHKSREPNSSCVPVEDEMPGNRELAHIDDGRCDERCKSKQCQQP